MLTDALPMLEVVARCAKELGITNIETQAFSADELQFGDASFDTSSVRLGYMLFSDLPRQPPSSYGYSSWAADSARRSAQVLNRACGSPSPCRQSRPSDSAARTRTGRTCNRCTPSACTTPAPGITGCMGSSCTRTPCKQARLPTCAMPAATGDTSGQWRQQPPRG